MDRFRERGCTKADIQEPYESVRVLDREKMLEYKREKEAFQKGKMEENFSRCFTTQYNLKTREIKNIVEQHWNIHS